MSRNQGRANREKGKRGERAFAKLLQSYGWQSARRGVQFQGGPDSPDVVCAEFPFHVEVKNVNRFRLGPFTQQAAKDSGDARYVVAVKLPQKPWLIIIPQQHMCAWYKEFTANMVGTKNLRLWPEMEKAKGMAKHHGNAPMLRKDSFAIVYAADILPLIRKDII